MIVHMKFITILCFFFVSLYTVGVVAGQDDSGDGKISFYNYQLDEVFDGTYRQNGKYDNKVLDQINHVMRSPDGKVSPISVKLIEILDKIQDHFNIDTIEIISGYRSPQYNKDLKTLGRTVAKESMHLKGMAADIHLDEITEQGMREYVISMNAGGVGFYPEYNFVHVDVGSQRSWGEANNSKRKLIGTEANPNNAWAAITDKNVYFKGDLINLEIKNISYESMRLTKNLWYEYFKKGKWAEHQPIEKNKQSVKIKPNDSVKIVWNPEGMPFGKYRIVVFTSKDFSVPPIISNEFYIKKTVTEQKGTEQLLRTFLLRDQFYYVQRYFISNRRF